MPIPFGAPRVRHGARAYPLRGLRRVRALRQIETILYRTDQSVVFHRLAKICE